MNEAFFQVSGKHLAPASVEDQEKLKDYKQNQIVRVKIYGVKRPRSVLQNRWIHAMFRIVADNSDDPEWGTPESVKRKVKMAMKFFKDDVTVAGNKVYFELRSFAFDKMESNEANVRFEDAKNIMAKKLGVKPETLEAESQRE